MANMEQKDVEDEEKQQKEGSDTGAGLANMCLKLATSLLKEDPPENVAALVAVLTGLTIATMDIATAIREQKKV